MSYRVHPSSGTPPYVTVSPRLVAPNSAFADYATLSGSTQGLQTKAVSAAYPTTGQVLVYNGTLWAPGLIGASDIALPLALSGANGNSLLSVTNTVSGNAAISGISSAHNTTGYLGGSVAGAEGYATGGADGVYGVTDSGLGVYGNAGSGDGVAGTSSTGYGVYGTSAQGNGVVGNSSTSGDGLVGNSADGAGVYGSSGDGYGGYFTTGGANGLYAVTTDSNGTGILGVASNGSSAYGVEGSSASGKGVVGFGAVQGVYGSVGNGTYGFLGGVDPTNGFPAGVVGADASGSSSHGSGVYGTSTNGDGVIGISASGTAGYFSSGGFYGLYATTSQSNGTAIRGVSGTGTDAAGLYGQADGGDGVYGTSANGSGVYGTSGSGDGIYGYSANGTAVYGDGGANGVGVFGVGHSLAAGSFVGDVIVTGKLTAGTKDFKIDHPLDPAHKYLYHASVESDQMEDVYSGNVVLGSDGAATVQMPAWFQSLNGDFRYVLTCIGGFAPVYIAQKVANNQFGIAGGKPGMEVSWQVTGVRHDAFALAHPLQVEQDKPEGEQGLYQNPEAFGLTEDKGIGYARRQAHQRPAPSAQP